MTDGPSECVFSEDRVYRYVLRHTFDYTKIDTEGFIGSVNFVMLNPSTADEKQLDPTLRRCRNFAKLWGYGSFVVTNLFAYRATSPLDMKRATDPIGPDNDMHLTLEAYRADIVIAGWGVHGQFQSRQHRIKSLLVNDAKRLCHLGLNGDGSPKHPLYLLNDTLPIDWK